MRGNGLAEAGEADLWDIVILTNSRPTNLNYKILKTITLVSNIFYFIHKYPSSAKRSQEFRGCFCLSSK